MGAEPLAASALLLASFQGRTAPSCLAKRGSGQASRERAFVQRRDAPGSRSACDSQ